MNQLKKIASQCLGRNIPSSKVYANVLAVDSGVKPAYLYDLGSPDAYKLYRFIHLLHQYEYIENNCLKVLEIGMDSLIVNVEVVKRIAGEMDKNNPIFVNVSKECKRPCILQDKDVTKKLISQLQTLLMNLQSCDAVYSMDIEQSCNVTSLFGLLLNYPVIYWYSCSSGDDGDNDGENCLSHERLTVVQLHAKLQPMKLGNVDLSEVFGESFNHTLYQFSFPTELASVCMPVVEKWVELTKEKVHRSSLFCDVKVRYEEQVLNAVML